MFLIRLRREEFFNWIWKENPFERPSCEHIVSHLEQLTTLISPCVEIRYTPPSQLISEEVRKECFVVIVMVFHVVVGKTTGTRTRHQCLENTKKRLYCNIIYIYKTVVCDRVLTLYRPCAYPGAVLRHASGPTGPRNSSRSFSPFIKSSLPGSSISRCSRKQTQPSLSKINNSSLKMKLFLSKGFFSTLSWFCRLVRPRFKI